mmetsp:Transcript_38747/g.95144  ORF Transcript_38747/g.95144 Transcript_38747/m.95144 type:complete len:114 (+) Transcript_38747:2-343(+)
MNRDPAQRLGARSSRDVQEHPFFEGIDVEALAKKEVTLIPGVADRRKQTNPYELLPMAQPEVFEPQSSGNPRLVAGWEFDKPENQAVQVTRDVAAAGDIRGSPANPTRNGYGS